LNSRSAVRKRPKLASVCCLLLLLLKLKLVLLVLL
jgi:hypothetical protein